jgi:hypothetical protein
VAVINFTFPYTNSPAFFTGIAATPLVPSVFPVAIDGRPYMIDQKSGRFSRGYEQRVRDSQDISTAPGESSINPGGLWRRGQDSWHFGAGQKYADTAEAKDYRFYKSKGIDVWTKGQISLLNETKLSFGSTATTVHSVAQGPRVYASFDADVKYSTDPYTSITRTVSNVSASSGTITYTTSVAHGFTAGQVVDITGISPTAYNLTGATIAGTPTTTTFTVTNGATGTFVSGGTAVQRPVWLNCTNEPGGNCAAMATDGNKIYLAFPSDGVRQIIPSSSVAAISNTKFVNSNDSYYMLAFAKQFMFGAHDHKLRAIDSGGSPSDAVIPGDSTFRWVGVATGQNAVYAAGYSGNKSLIYKITITSAGLLDSGVVALELPTGEVVTAISGYLGYILLGTNKGARYCTTDDQSNLVAGPIIPTSGAVYKFTSEDRYTYFTWTNYDGTSGGLGRLDLSAFTSTNAPAYATDLMYNSAATVSNALTFDSKRCFMIAGIGFIAQDSSKLVESGEIETGIWRWGIPDRKFVAKIDTRATPLVGSISQYLQIDEGSWVEAGLWDDIGTTEDSVDGLDDKAIEAAFKFKLTRSSTNTATGPTMTRWMARAYVAPFRSQQFVVPILLHDTVKVRDKEYYYDVDEHQRFFDGLIESPRIIALQIGNFTHTVIVDDVEWLSADAHGNTWTFQGTLVVTLRSVEN